MKLSRGERYENRWTVGEWTFYEVAGHGFPTNPDKPVFRYERDGIEDHAQDPDSYGSLEQAMAAAIASKHTGVRGAGGTGVGTAADWFIRSLGLGHPVELEQGEARDAVVTALAESEGFPAVGPAVFARRVLGQFGKLGVFLAKESGR